MTPIITWTEFNRGGDACTMRHSEPKRMTRQEALDAVAEWYDAIGSGLNDFDGIQLVCVKREEGGEK